MRFLWRTDEEEEELGILVVGWAALNKLIPYYDYFWQPLARWWHCGPAMAVTHFAHPPTNPRPPSPPPPPPNTIHTHNFLHPDCKHRQKHSEHNLFHHHCHKPHNNVTWIWSTFVADIQKWIDICSDHFAEKSHFIRVFFQFNSSGIRHDLAFK